MLTLRSFKAFNRLLIENFGRWRESRLSSSQRLLFNSSNFENFHVRDKLIVQLSFPMQEHMMLHQERHFEENWFPKWKTRQKYGILLFPLGIENPKYQLYIRNWIRFSSSCLLAFHQWKYPFHRDWKGGMKTRSPDRSTRPSLTLWDIDLDRENFLASAHMELLI